MAIPVPVANDKLDGGAKFAGIQLIFIYLLMTSTHQSNCSQGSFICPRGWPTQGSFVNRGLLRGHLPQGLICQLRYIIRKISLMVPIQSRVHLTYTVYTLSRISKHRYRINARNHPEAAKIRSNRAFKAR
jgi:hypothetical protein